MRSLLNITMVSALAMCAFTGLPAAGQSAAKIPRTPDGKPNLNGIWQTMNTAELGPAGTCRRTEPGIGSGAEGAEPGGLSVVEGGEIPYLPAALAKKKENFTNRLKADPEVKCYLPGVPRATYMPYPFQILQSEKTC